MRKIKVEELTREAFAPFGAYYDFANPDGYALTGEIHRFYPDRLRDAYLGHAGFSALTVRKPERMVVRSIEYHTHSAEIVLPLNDDAVLHAAPASNGVPVTELAKAFLVPKKHDGAAQPRRVAPVRPARAGAGIAGADRAARMHLRKRLYRGGTQRRTGL